MEPFNYPDNDSGVPPLRLGTRGDDRGHKGINKPLRHLMFMDIIVT
jgi:hypothetical protein